MKEVFFNIFLLIIGMVFLIKGADFFVDGSASIARKLKIPSLVIGLTLVSMGTSAPEASVSISSSIKGLSDISLGNIIGSNIFNILIVMGVSLLFIKISVSKQTMIFEFPFVILITCLLGLFCYVISPGTISRIEGIILLILFIGYLVFIIVRALKNKEETEDLPKEIPVWKSIIFVVIGLAGVIFGGNWVVNSSSFIAKQLGMSDALVGLTIVAIGTSLPELVTSFVAAKKGENDIALGNVLGSNIFNILFILGLSSTILPMEIKENVLVDLIFCVAITIIVFLLCIKTKQLVRWNGIVFIVLYCLYFTYIILRNYNIISF